MNGFTVECEDNLLLMHSILKEIVIEFEFDRVSTSGKGHKHYVFAL
jgi:hypothetical protein